MDKSLTEMDYFNCIYSPFGNGPRTCIGNKLAITEVKMILFELVRAFRFQPVPGVSYKRRQFLTVRPDPPLKTIVTRI